ncbi:MAG: Porin [Hyphomicrobiales bacterium]|nr:Porin [Hyphomicrobiales bacterium]
MPNRARPSRFFPATPARALAAAAVLLAASTELRAADSAPMAPSWRGFDGLTLGLLEQAEVWGGLGGGRRRGVTANGLLTLTVEGDLGKLAGLQDWSFYVSALQIHGRGPTQNLVGNVQTVSNIEASRATKLYNAWIAPSFFDGRVQMRIGQAGANDEMMISRQAQLFLNSSFGFPALLATNLPSGGPNYPIAGVMARAIVKLDDRFSIMTAVFNGDPAGPGPGDPQLRDRNGIAFRVNDHRLVFNEVWFAPDGGSGGAALPGLWKIGAWAHTGDFQDQRFDAAGAPLALGGPARRLRGNHAVYAVADQMLWRKPGTQDEGLGVWGLAMASPADRNVVSAFLEGGVTFKGAFDRPDDVAGLAFAYMRVSDAARGFYRDGAAAGAGLVPAAPYELALEATYLHKASSQFTIQPSLQYVVNPGARLPASPNRFSQAPLRNATVLGVRTSYAF